MLWRNERLKSKNCYSTAFQVFFFKYFSSIFQVFFSSKNIFKYFFSRIFFATKFHDYLFSQICTWIKDIIWRNFLGDFRKLKIIKYQINWYKLMGYLFPQNFHERFSIFCFWVLFFANKLWKKNLRVSIFRKVIKVWESLY